MKDYMTLIVALIGVMISIISVFNKEQEKGEQLQYEYFKILYSYFELKNVNNLIDPIEFINRYKYKNICIPPYIYYLAEENEGEKLENVMKVDYWFNYPNVVNNTFKIVGKFSKITYFIGIIFTAIATMGAIFMVFATVEKVFDSVENIFTYDFIKYFIAGIILCLLYILIPYIFRGITEDLGQEIDEYSSKKKTIERTIRKKLKIYNQRKDKYYL